MLRLGPDKFGALLKESFSTQRSFRERSLPLPLLTLTAPSWEVGAGCTLALQRRKWGAEVQRLVQVSLLEDGLTPPFLAPDPEPSLASCGTARCSLGRLEGLGIGVHACVQGVGVHACVQVRPRAAGPCLQPRPSKPLRPAL